MYLVALLWIRSRRFISLMRYLYHPPYTYIFTMLRRSGVGTSGHWMLKFINKIIFNPNKLNWFTLITLQDEINLVVRTADYHVYY